MHYRIILCLYLLILPQISIAQTFLEFSWKSPQEYKAFIIHYSEADILVRVAFPNGIAEFQAEGKYLERGDTSYYCIDGLNETVNVVVGNVGYLADNFLLSNKGVFHDDDGGSPRSAAVVKELTDDDLGPIYLHQFFAFNDPLYTKLLRGEVKSTTAIAGKGGKIDHTIGAIHAIVVSNSFSADKGGYDQNFAKAIQVDIDRFQEHFKGIADALAVKCHFQHVRDQQASPEAVAKMVDSLQFAPNDVVLFLYRGHGFRWFDQSSSYPRMDLRTAPTHDLNQSLNIHDDILEKIRQKSPKLCIVLGDLCNTQQMRPTVPMASHIPVVVQHDAHFDPQLTVKMLSAKGYGIAVSARKGQVSYADPDLGGYFTKSFFDAFNREISKTKGKGDWKRLIKHTMGLAERLSISKNRPGQEGLFDMKNIRYGN